MIWNRPISQFFRKRIWLLFLLLPGFALAQNPCSDHLNQARNLFQEGKLQQVIEHLDQCIQAKQAFSTSEERIQALRLVALAHAYRDHQEKAQDLMEEIFKEDPLYQIDPDFEPREFVALYNSFRVLPRISIGINTGLSIPFFNVIQQFTVGNELQNTGGYGFTQGIIAGANLDLALAKRLYFSPGISISQRRIRFNDLVYDFTDVEYFEKQLFLNVPFALKYEFAERKFIPFVKAGASLDILLSARANLTRNFPGSVTPSVKANGLDVYNQRIPLNLTPWIALGAGYRIGRGKLELQIGFRPSFTNITRGKNRYSENDLMFKYLFIHDDLIVHQLDFQVGYSHTFFRIIPQKNKK